MYHIQLSSKNREITNETSPNNFLQKSYDSMFTINLILKLLTVIELYLKFTLKLLSLKCYHKDYEIVEMDAMWNVDFNHSYRARCKSAQLVIPKPVRNKLTTMSLEHRGRDLLDFLQP